eukprot:gene6237-6876_t
MLDHLSPLSLKQIFGTLCQSNITEDTSSSSSSTSSRHYLFPQVEVVLDSPSINRYLLANPRSFLSHPELAKQYGCDLTLLQHATDYFTLLRQLPVIYIADIHSELGSLGLQLNKQVDDLVIGDLYPSLRALRNRPIYLGGVNKKGSSFMMVHQKAGFPDNRAWRILPGHNDFRLFFSPDVAMANELVSTKDAKVEDFK